MEFHETYDLYFTPSAASIAPKIGELTPSAADERKMKEQIQQLAAKEQLAFVYEMFLPSLTYTPFTQLANLTGQPAISLPVYKTKAGMPIGVQAMAAKGNESLLFRLALTLEQSERWQG